MSSSPPSTCQRCGTRLPRQSLGSLCPRCVGRRLLDPSPAPPPAPELAEEDSPGRRIGRYRLAEKLGEGGGGLVFAADQEEPVRRRVALKMLKLGMDTRAVIARFEAERQTLAMMDHPHVAKVFDAGATPAGRPYFVMELVPGQRITEFCEQHQFTSEARLELFITVCQAVQHAHQKGIIHRDLKPSNILVTTSEGVPIPKIIDFGIAKATGPGFTEATLVTEAHQLLGTPAYMSPEQADGRTADLDTRTDIYSLGVVLYELLTGHPPFDAKQLRGAGLEQMRRTIREQEPLTPSARLTRERLASRPYGPEKAGTSSRKPPIAQDLDWIVMKCLEKDRARRYESANALAADLRRHLAHEPVTAVAPTAGYLFRKFARRHQAGLAIAALFILVLLATAGISGWQAIRATRAETMARQRADESDAARREAEAIAQFLTDILESPDPAHAGRAATVLEMLGRTGPKIEADATLPPAHRARLQLTLGRTYRGLGQYREATVLFEKVLAYHRVASGPIHPDTLDAMGNLAAAYHDATRKAEALKLSQEVVAGCQQTYGPEHPKTLLATSYLAWSFFSSQDNQRAIRLEEQVLADSRRVNGAEHPNTVLAMSYLGSFYSMANRHDEALPLQIEALSQIRHRLGPEHPDTLNAMIALAGSQHKSGRMEEAIGLLQQAIPLSQKLKGPAHPETLWAMSTLADTYYNNARWREAAQHYQSVLDLSLQANGPDHERTRKAGDRLRKARQAELRNGGSTGVQPLK